MDSSNTVAAYFKAIEGGDLKSMKDLLREKKVQPDTTNKV